MASDLVWTCSFCKHDIVADLHCSSCDAWLCACPRLHEGGSCATCGLNSQKVAALQTLGPSNCFNNNGSSETEEQPLDPQEVILRYNTGQCNTNTNYGGGLALQNQKCQNQVTNSNVTGPVNNNNVSNSGIKTLNDSWSCPCCYHDNSTTNNQICENPQCGYPAKDWRCPVPTCTNLNWEGRFKCNRCNTPHPAAGPGHLEMFQQGWCMSQGSRVYKVNGSRSRALHANANSKEEGGKGGSKDSFHVSNLFGGKGAGGSGLNFNKGGKSGSNVPNSTKRGGPYDKPVTSDNLVNNIMAPPPPLQMNQNQNQNTSTRLSSSSSGEEDADANNVDSEGRNGVPLYMKGPDGIEWKLLAVPMKLEGGEVMSVNGEAVFCLRRTSTEKV